MDRGLTWGRGDQARWSPGVSVFSESKLQGVPGVS